MTGRVISHWQHRDREVTDVGQNIFQTVTCSNPLTLVPWLLLLKLWKFSSHNIWKSLNSLNTHPLLLNFSILSFISYLKYYNIHDRHMLHDHSMVFSLFLTSNLTVNSPHYEIIVPYTPNHDTSQSSLSPLNMENQFKFYILAHFNRYYEHCSPRLLVLSSSVQWGSLSAFCSCWTINMRQADVECNWLKSLNWKTA